MRAAANPSIAVRPFSLLRTFCISSRIHNAPHQSETHACSGSLANRFCCPRSLVVTVIFFCNDFQSQLYMICKLLSRIRLGWQRRRRTDRNRNMVSSPLSWVQTPSKTPIDHCAVAFVEYINMNVMANI